MSPQKPQVESATTDDIISLFSTSLRMSPRLSSRTLPRMPTHQSCTSSLSPSPRHCPRPSQSNTLPLPQTYREYEQQLAASSRLFPANIPVLVVEGYDPDHTVPGHFFLEPGMIVSALYKNRDLVCVKTAGGQRGFVPMMCLKPIGVLPHTGQSEDTTHSAPAQVVSPTSNHSLNSSGHSQGDSSGDDQLYIEETTFCSCCPYEHVPQNDNHEVPSVNMKPRHIPRLPHTITKLTVLFDYKATHFDDVSVYQDEVVMSSDDEGCNWIWVKKSNGKEGYIPKQYVVDMAAFNMEPGTRTSYF